MNRLFDRLINEPDLTNIQPFIDFIICKYENSKYFPITYDSQYIFDCLWILNLSTYIM